MERGKTYAATIGFFDGVHRGHQFLVEQLRALAAERGLHTAVITFDRHPRQVLQPGWQPQLITTLEEKERLLRATGIDRLVVLPFTEQTARLSARDFMRQVLAEELGVNLLLTGYDNHFGHRTKDSSEGFNDYADYGRELGIEVVCGQPLTSHPSPFTSHPSPFTFHHSPLTTHHSPNISSSLVRRLLSEGRMEEAASCLGRCYDLPGTVEHGERQGHRLGFPTANLCPEALRIVPRGGVYAVRVHTAEGRFGGMTNIGLRPTFDGHRQTIETHLFNYDGDLYGQRMTIDFVARLRDEQHFDSPEALARQMALDAQAAEELLKQSSL